MNSPHPYKQRPLSPRREAVVPAQDVSAHAPGEGDVPLRRARRFETLRGSLSHVHAPPAVNYAHQQPWVLHQLLVMTVRW